MSIAGIQGPVPSQRGDRAARPVGGVRSLAIERRSIRMDKVVHFEIPAENLERAKKFYQDNFGWKLNQMGPDMGNYVLAHTGPTDEQGMVQDKAFINGGLMPRNPAVSSPVLVIAVDDADAAVEKVKKSGGA